MKKREVNLSFHWSRRPDSNRRPGDYKSPALPAELLRQDWVEVVGFEPATF